MYKIDYSIVKTEKDLIEWARDTFNLPSLDEVKLINNSKTDTVIGQIWNKVVESGQEEIVIYESYPRHQSKKIRSILHGTENVLGWKSILGFFLYRDYLMSVRFMQDPNTKGKRPKKS